MYPGKTRRRIKTEEAFELTVLYEGEELAVNVQLLHKIW
jgi:hypothetical protein